MKKAQAAMEFLTTYGWAMTVLVLVLGALYLGFMYNPSTAVADSCTFIDAFSCEDFQVLSSGTVNLSMRNIAGKAVSVRAIDCEYNNAVYTNVINPAEPPGMDVASGAFFGVGCNLTQTLPNEKVRIKITIRYVEDGLSFLRSSDGSLVAGVSS